MDAVAFLPFLLYRPSWRHKSLAAGIPRIFYSFFHIFFFFFNNTSNSLNKLTIWTTLTLVCFLILFSHIERFKTKIQIQKKNEKPEHGKGQKDETSPHTITPEIKKKKNFESHDMIIFLFPLFFFFLVPPLNSFKSTPNRRTVEYNEKCQFDVTQRRFKFRTCFFQFPTFRIRTHACLHGPIGPQTHR